MFEVEIWIDVGCRTGSQYGAMCTLFADQRVPMRPMIGETLSFHPSHGTSLEFNSPIGPSRQRLVTVTIDEVSHYAVRNDGEVSYKTTLRCSEILVLSEQDARTVCEFMTKQMGFDIAPYATNKLQEPSNNPPSNDE
jgi:hypothetical protein